MSKYTNNNKYIYSIVSVSYDRISLAINLKKRKEKMMKKKILRRGVSVVMVTASVMGMMGGCGGKNKKM